MKYKLTNTTKMRHGVTLHQIEVLKNFSDVKKGERDRWIEHERNLSYKENCLINGNLFVKGHSILKGHTGTKENYYMQK